MKSSDKQSTIKWTLVGSSIILAGVGIFFGFRLCQDHLVNKVYNRGEIVSFSDFQLDVTKADFRPVELPLNNESVSMYGGLEESENCQEASRDGAWFEIGGQWRQVPGGVSPYVMCEARNGSRDAIKKYSGANMRFDVDYNIIAKNNVDTDSLKFEIIPNSGRDVSAQVNELNSNDFFRNCMREPIMQSGAPGPTYTEGCLHEPTTYTPYFKSDIGKDISKGLGRSGRFNTDIRNTEKAVDIKITYKNESRLIRISR